MRLRLFRILRAYSFILAIIAVSADSTKERALGDLKPLATARGIERNTTSSAAAGALYEVRAQVERGSVEAFYILGLFNLYGLQSLEPDEEDALNWFRKAAGEGHRDAQCAAGILLYHGYGRVEADRVAAESYFRRASNANHAYGRWLLGRSLFREASAMTTRNDDRDGKAAKAASLFASVAEEIPEASHRLAIMFEYGLVEAEEEGASDLLRAAELYEKASRKGFVESTYHLALMRVYGRGVPQDYVVAAELFRRAASNRPRPHAPSMRYLAVIYANGYSRSAGIPDYDEALGWYERCMATDASPDVRDRCVAEHDALSEVVSTAREMSRADA